MEAQLAALKRDREALLSADSEKKPEQPAAKLNPEQVRGGRQLDIGIAALQSQIQAKNLDLEERTKSQKQVVALINQYNSRIQSSPLMEREYTDLTRDYALAKARYEELNAKKSQSEVATSLENRGQGERLQLLDQASLPETPTKPKRMLIIGAGIGIGLFLGMFLAGARRCRIRR